MYVTAGMAVENNVKPSPVEHFNHTQYYINNDTPSFCIINDTKNCISTFTCGCLRYDYIQT